MCINCLSTAEHQAACAILVAAIVREPAHRALATLGVVPHPDPVGRDRRTVAFLRGLELDPVAVLGAEVVAAADAWTYEESPAARFRARKRSSAAPIGSQSLAITR
jgi:hypothetical protein